MLITKELDIQMIAPGVVPEEVWRKRLNRQSTDSESIATKSVCARVKFCP